jgi:hypothetical protein
VRHVEGGHVARVEVGVLVVQLGSILQKLNLGRKLFRYIFICMYLLNFRTNSTPNNKHICFCLSIMNNTILDLKVFMKLKRA